MPWKECDRVDQRRELTELAMSGAVPIAELARRFGVSRKTVYKWLSRRQVGGVLEGLRDRSRRPLSCPHRTSAEMLSKVLSLRSEHPSWGGRKLHHRLRALGERGVPAASTITGMLRDHGRIDPLASEQRQAWRRFEHARPNDLWQMDFKSPLSLVDGGTCHPLTVLDDHSRYALNLSACVNQRRETVQGQLARLFARYGRPWALLSDNGSPWGASDVEWGWYTRIEVWLMRLDIRVIHGRAYHPQTQGKEERFHRTLQVELLQGRSFRDHQSVQAAFDPWREMYNRQRPHEALGFATPAERYAPSSRCLPATLPEVEYDAGDQVRRVDGSGQFRFHRRKCRAGKAFTGECVAMRPTQEDGAWSVHLGRFEIGRLNLREVGPHQFVHVCVRRSGRCAPSAADTHEEKV